MRNITQILNQLGPIGIPFKVLLAVLSQIWSYVRLAWYEQKYSCRIHSKALLLIQDPNKFSLGKDVFILLYSMIYFFPTLHIGSLHKTNS